jgi:uncharacterized protein YbaA (DUF1428 family)
MGDKVKGFVGKHKADNRGPSLNDQRNVAGSLDGQTQHAVLNPSLEKGQIMPTSATPIYIDGFVASVPTAQKDAYLAHCCICAPVFLEAGALRIVDAWGDDVPHGKLTDFHMAAKAKAGETVNFGWIEWPSKAIRDAGMAKVMADPRMAADVNPMPFDSKRMIYGGFAMLNDCRA